MKRNKRYEDDSTEELSAPTIEGLYSEDGKNTRTTRYVVDWDSM